MSNDFRLLLLHEFSQPWLVDRDWLNAIVDISSYGNIDRFKSAKPEQRASDNTIYITGAIVPRSSAYYEAAIGNGLSVSSVEDISDQLDELYQSADEIVLVIDSPGGAVTGISELADKIYSMRPKIRAYVPGMAASAAYWLASATNSITVADTAEVGSVGVVMSYVDVDGFMEKLGVSRTDIVSSNAPLKRVKPNEPDGLVYYQKRVDDIARVFTEKVAKYRGVHAQHVSDNFGNGGLVGANDAIKNGMVDAINNLNKTNGVTRIMTTESEKNMAAVDAQIDVRAILAENDKLNNELDALSEKSRTELSAAVKVERERILSLISIAPDFKTLTMAVEKGMSPGELAIGIIADEKARGGKANKEEPLVSYSTPSESSADPMRDELLAAMRRITNVG